jgi:hypothetical protein
MKKNIIGRIILKKGQNQKNNREKKCKKLSKFFSSFIFYKLKLNKSVRKEKCKLDGSIFY